MPSRPGLTLLALTLLLLGPRWAVACSTCMSGDPTLTTLGLEKPFPGRLRITAGVMYRTESVGRDRIDHKDLTQTTATLALAWWPRADLALGVRLPWVWKEIKHTNTAETWTSALGDLSLDLRYYLTQYGGTQGHHLFALTASLRIPTAAQIHERGRPLDFDAQPGTGQSLIEPGFWYGFYAYPWFGSAQVAGQIGIGTGYQGYRFGNGFRASVLGQYAATRNLALQAGVDVRWSAPDSLGGMDDPDSGGFIGHLGMGLVVNVRPDLLLAARGQLPVLDALHGDHDEGPIVRVELAYDF